MITPIITMTINQIAERKYDLLMSDDDIKEMAKNVREKVIEEFTERLKAKAEKEISWQMFLDEDDLLDKDQIYKYIDEIAEQLKAGGKNE